MVIDLLEFVFKIRFKTIEQFVSYFIIASWCYLISDPRKGNWFFFWYRTGLSSLFQCGVKPETTDLLDARCRSTIEGVILVLEPFKMSATVIVNMHFITLVAM
jgi:hypothetical protein